MSKTWQQVRLGQVVRLDLNSVPIDAVTTYPMVGVLSFGRGLFDREPIENGKTSYRHFYRLKAEHVVMSQLFGWEGALALGSEKFAGKFLSPQFPTFLCDGNQLDRGFLGWLMRRPAFWEDLGSRTSGMGDRRRTLNPEALFACQIPLPSLPEQRRIVARVESLAAKIENARDLRQQAVQDEERLLICMAHREDLPTTEKVLSGWFEATVGSICRFTDESESVDGSRSYPNLGIYSYGRGVFPKPPIEGTATSAHTLRRVRAGQFIYSRLFAFEGAYAMVPPELDGHYVSGEYPTFTCDPTKACAEFLWAHFRSPNVWQTVAVGSKGLGNRRQRVQPDRVLEHKLWVPPMEWQRKIQSAQSKVDALKKLQAETATELAALLPSILDKAFKGQL